MPQRTNDLAAPTVTVAPAKPGAPVENLVLPGNVTAYTDSPIYARTDGYLLHWYFDIGAKVKKGDSAGRDRHAGTGQAGGAGRSRPGDRARPTPTTRASRPIATRDWSNPTPSRSRTPTRL